MVLWQFVTLTVLIAAVLVYAIVITLRLGRADARLNKIEDAVAFLAMSRSSESTESRAAEVAPEVSGGKEVSGGYLTIRDLRARSVQMSSRTTRPDIDNPAAAQEMRAAWKMMRGQMKWEDPGPERGGDSPAPMGEPLPTAPPVQPLSTESVATEVESSDAPLTGSEPLGLPAIEAMVGREPAGPSVESRDEPAQSSEPLSLPIMDEMSEAPAAQSVERHDEPAANSEPQSHPAPSEDSAARKNRETVLFLSNQRRRRRERLGH